jgi:hypothetical protein
LVLGKDGVVLSRFRGTSWRTTRSKAAAVGCELHVGALIATVLGEFTAACSSQALNRRFVLVVPQPARLPLFDPSLVAQAAALAQPGFMVPRVSR